MKWEYKFEKLPKGDSGNPEREVEMFNRLGNDGWEFMWANEQDFPGYYIHDYYYVYYFKRIKE